MPFTEIIARQSRRVHSEFEPCHQNGRALLLGGETTRSTASRARHMDKKQTDEHNSCLTIGNAQDTLWTTQRVPTVGDRPGGPPLRRAALKCIASKERDRMTQALSAWFACSLFLFLGVGG